MLQNMQAKVAEEGEKEQELFDKYMCYCKTNTGTLQESIEAASAKIEGFGADLKAKVEKKAQLESELSTNKESKASAEEELATAKALRAKEAKEFAELKADYETNIAALKKAVAAIEAGTSTAFLQSRAAGLIKNFALDRAEISDSNRQELLAFLSGSSSSDYAPQSGEIVGILKTLGDEMVKALEEATTEESEAIANFESLVAAKQKELSSLQQQIEERMERIGTIGVEVAETGEDLENTKETLAEDQKFQAELAEGCKTKEAEWEEVKKARAEETVALAETIKVLNDDDALEIFKKALPAPEEESFLQVQVSSKATLSRALKVVRSAARKSNKPELDLLSLALRGKKVGFEKVIAMVDEMVVNLKKEQSDDDSKKEFCNTKLDEAEDKQKALELSISDIETVMGELASSIEALKEDIKALEVGIKALDKSVAEATEERKAANAEYKDLVASNKLATEVLAWAKNRLNKYYNPKLYIAPKEGDPAPEGGVAGTGIGAVESFVQIRAHIQLKRAAPPPPPEAVQAYSKKSEESNGVIKMIDLLVADLDKETQEAEVMEKDAQADYEKLMKDAADKRAADSKAVAQKESSLANTEEALEDAKSKKEATVKEMMGNGEYLSSLHAECDWLLKYFETRKEARTSEIQSLADAKAVLSGADYSFIQQSRTLAIRRFSA